MANLFQLKVYGALCSTELFEIKGKAASSDDFGESSDESRETAEEYGCGNRVWRGRMPTTEVLQKYNITVEEYAEIVEALHERLSFGRCGWCV